MYESQTYEVILDRMLARVATNLDKRQGAVIWDALAPAAAELAQVYIYLDKIYNDAFPDTAPREFLVRIAAMRGMEPDAETNAIVLAHFVPETLAIATGSRWSCEEFNYAVTEPYTNEAGTAVAGYYLLSCETAGAEPNGTTGPMLPIDYVTGLEYAEILSVEVPGEDEETTEAFRQRYYDSLHQQASGGNIAWYLETVHAIDGVGGCKVYRAWQGAGTVKLVITDSSYGVPSPTLLAKVQEEIDPGVSGEGIGLAPIGHFVTVTGVAGQTVDLSAHFTLEEGVTLDEIRTSLEAAVDSYFRELAQTWEEETYLIVRLSQVEMRMLNVSGVIDMEHIALNGQESNLPIDADSIPERGRIDESG